MNQNTATFAVIAFRRLGQVSPDLGYIFCLAVLAFLCVAATYKAVPIVLVLALKQDEGVYSLWPAQFEHVRARRFLHLDIMSSLAFCEDRF